MNIFKYGTQIINIVTCVLLLIVSGCSDSSYQPFEVDAERPRSTDINNEYNAFALAGSYTLPQVVIGDASGFLAKYSEQRNAAAQKRLLIRVHSTYKYCISHCILTSKKKKVSVVTAWDSDKNEFVFSEYESHDKRLKRVLQSSIKLLENVYVSEFGLNRDVSNSCPSPINIKWKSAINVYQSAHLASIDSEPFFAGLKEVIPFTVKQITLESEIKDLQEESHVANEQDLLWRSGRSLYRKLPRGISILTYAFDESGIEADFYLDSKSPNEGYYSNYRAQGRFYVNNLDENITQFELSGWSSDLELNDSRVENNLDNIFITNDTTRFSRNVSGVLFANNNEVTKAVCFIYLGNPQTIRHNYFECLQRGLGFPISNDGVIAEDYFGQSKSTYLHKFFFDQFAENEVQLSRFENYFICLNKKYQN